MLLFAVGCRTADYDPLEGWKGGHSLIEGNPFDQVITDDYKAYIQGLPTELRNVVVAGNIHFYEDGTGQHAVRISIGYEGKWREHVLIYNKEDKRVNVIKYISGRYAS